ncbi:MAG: type II secretion system protein [Athalassotoga sp.]|uniref:type II secretion system protein n=1 Tax=Athalassotoga sp. TaxID=2022597 RepID=UPI003D00A79F
MFKKRREGFTLVELLIVMAVIAALMGALIPVAINAINHANATRIAENLQSLVTQVQQYAYSEHAIPSINSLKSSVSGGNIGDYQIYVYANGTSKNPSPGDYQIPSNATSVQFAVVYMPSFSAAAVHNVWNGVVPANQINWLTSNTSSASPAATGVVVRYW